MHRINLVHDKDQWWALANRLNASQERLGSLVHSIKLSHVATPVQFMTPRSQNTQKRRAPNGIRTWKSLNNMPQTSEAQTAPSQAQANMAAQTVSFNH
jgi:single-stranded DNA-binding protein